MGVVERTRVSQVTPESPGIPHAMVYGLYVPSPAIGFLATVIRAPLRELDTSTEMSGPHDFAVRSKHRRQRATASTASRSDVRDVRETPL